MKCQNCGATSEKAIAFCGYCGSPATLAVTVPALAGISPDMTPPGLEALALTIATAAQPPVIFPPPWGYRFALIEKAGGAEMPRVRELTFGQRAGLLFNFWAMFFGVFYYLSKGMGKKGFAIVAVSVVAVVIMQAIGGAVGATSGLVMPVLFATRANLDYYKKVVLNDTGWW